MDGLACEKVSMPGPGVKKPFHATRAGTLLSVWNAIIAVSHSFGVHPNRER